MIEGQVGGGTGGATPPDLQERIERTAIGRLAISVLIVAVLLAVVVWNMPGSALRASLVPLIAPVVESVGLQQDWALFAPEPQRQSLDFYAEVTLLDDTAVRWEPPRQHLWPAGARAERWRKWWERMRRDENEQLWRPTARWIAAQHGSAGGGALTVSLVRRWRDTPPPGEPLGDWNEYTFYIYDVATDGGVTG